MKIVWQSLEYSREKMKNSSPSTDDVTIFTEDAAEKFFPTSKISAQQIRHQIFLLWSNLTIMAHIMGLREPIRKLENDYPELKIY